MLKRLVPCVLVALLTAVTTGQVAAPPDLEARTTRLRETLADANGVHHVAGFSLAVVADDAIVFADGFGFADIEAGRPATPETLYAAGSTTKAFTSALLASLVDEGAVAWDDHVRTLLPDFRLADAKADDVVTIRDLLSHRVGLMGMDSLWYSGTAGWDDMRGAIARAEPTADLREKFQYQNLMYLAAGHAAAAGTGMSWEDAMRKRLLGPLGMASSNLSIDAMQSDPRAATGYRWDGDAGEHVAVPMRRLDTIAPAGALNSNVLDMAQWVRLQLAKGRHDGNQLIMADRFDEMWASQIDVSPGVSYGLGWMIREWNGRRLIEHGGNIDGFSAQVALLPDEGVGFVLLMNVGVCPLQAASISLVFDAWFGGDDAEETENTEDLARFAGVYHMDALDADLTVTIEDGVIAVDVPNQMVFMAGVPDADGWRPFRGFEQIRIAFDEDDAGKVTGMRLQQGGMTFELPRQGVERATEVTLDEVRPFLGSYRFEALAADVEVVVQNGRLAVDVPGQIVFEMHPPDDEGRRHFRATDTIWVRFEQDETGTVTAMDFNQRGVLTTLPKVSGVAEDLPNAEDIVALVRREGGVEAYERLYNLKLTGTFTMVNQGVTGTNTLVMAGHDRYWQRVDAPPFLWLETGWKDNDGFHRSSFDPVRALEPDELRSVQRQHPLAFIGPWSRLFDAVEMLAVEEDLAGKRTYVLRGTRETEPPTKLYVDAESGTVMRTEGKATIRGMAIPFKATFEDHRRVEGVWLPFRTVVEDNVNGKIVLEITSVETNVELDRELWVGE